MSKAAMQQALEALEMMRGKYGEYACSECDYADTAITALRAALAEPQTTHWEGCEAVHPECRAKPMTAAEMSAWVKDTWEKCQAEAWQKPSGSFVLWQNTLCNPLADPISMTHSAWHDGYASGVKEERKRICDMLLDMHAKEERHNYYGFIARMIKESA